MEDKESLEKRVRELEWENTLLRHDIIHDPLTGLKTRAYFDQDVSVYLEVIRRQSEHDQESGMQRRERFGFKNLSILFFDIDHFKKVNDEHGHEIGDVVLQGVSKAIRSSLRAEDTVARWGGEEIVVSLLGAQEKDASAKAEEIREAVQGLSFPEKSGLKVTVSAGVASSEPGISLHELVRRADQALYAAKEGGRNRVVAYSEIK